MESLQITKKLVSGTIIIFIGSILGKCAAYLFSVTAAKYFGISFFGIFTMGLTIINQVIIISSLGANSGILRFVGLFSSRNDYGRVKGTVIFLFLIVLPVSIILCVLLFMNSDFIAYTIFKKNHLFSSTIRILSICIPLQLCMSLLVRSTTALGIMKYHSLIENILMPFTRFIFLVVLLFYGVHYFELSIAYITSICIALFAAVIVFKKHFWKRFCLNKAIFEKKEIVMYIFPLFLVSVSNQFFKHSECLFLGFFKTARDVGLYAIAAKSAFLISLLPNAISFTFRPIIISLVENKSFEELEFNLRYICKWIFTFSLPVALYFIFFTSSFLSLLGPQFLEAKYCLMILSIGLLIGFSLGPVTAIINMSGKSKITLYNTVFFSFLSLLLFLLLIPKYGILGLALAQSIIRILRKIIVSIEVYILYKIHSISASFIKPLCFGLFSLLAVKLIAKFHTIENVIIYNGMILGILTIFYVFLLFLFGLTDQDKRIFSSIIEKIRNKF